MRWTFEVTRRERDCVSCQVGDVPLAVSGGREVIGPGWSSSGGGSLRLWGFGDRGRDGGGDFVFVLVREEGLSLLDSVEEDDADVIDILGR